ncbi:enoyl-CoA hydratase/isomerase family protein [Halieaceae bacterium IMCC14734]|uniref:Enoyl-CoA hydratase/isomerase family protein n=1 Tax=Candidatus Litorirhabdus singularis TaxID=2518993 RepID=A0ABT3TLU3_9GAMM|nr:enoyl-CoA hydratase-related protein [Candidatus Litorirhabdus singularis]MCX2983265.1 enoyl-CoA hydratase/isomerase family protein [Candidatus Litorirhabdus singularis]
MTETVLFEKDGPIARLVLNNPSRHNSLGEVELMALQQHIESVVADPQLRVLIVTGSGSKTFCAGAALNQLGAGQISGDLFQQTTDCLAAVPIPTVCALNGSVYGGGTELALSCDFRVGVQGTRLRVPAARIGLCYPIGGINRFVERLGVNIAKRILVGAEEFDAEAMLHIGFLDHLVPASELEAKVSDMAQSMAGLAPLAVQAMKAILQQAAAGAIDLNQAQAMAQTCTDSEDLQEGFAAQRERREPEFKGR